MKTLIALVLWFEAKPVRMLYTILALVECAALAEVIDAQAKLLNTIAP